MWKSIIIVTSLILALGSTNILAAGLEPSQKHTARDRSERNLGLDRQTTYNDMLTGYNLNDDVSVGFILGLDKVEQDSHEGPNDNSKGFGLGFGLSFSF